MTTVLIADKIATIHKHELDKRNGLAYRTTRRGDRVVWTIRTHDIDMLVINPDLAVIDGLTVVRALRKADYDLPILVYGLDDSREAYQAAIDAGADDYLSHTDADTLYATIVTMLAFALPERDIPILDDQIEAGKRRRLEKLLEIRARLGDDTPIAYLLEIDDLKKELGG